MGKASATSSAAAPTTTEMKRKKKKGRPSLTDLQNRQQIQINSNYKNTLITTSSSPPLTHKSTLSGRSARRNPNYPANSPFDEDDDDDDERQQKKVKLVVRLPQSNNLPHQHQQQLEEHSQLSDSCSGSEDSDADLDLGGDEHHVASPKNRKTNAVDRRSDDAFPVQEEKVSIAMDCLQGVEVETGPTTTLPDKKLLFFILDRLQKKDTYGVFSEPVDPNELPDYHEIIEHPMDFGTVRKKLNEGVYSHLEELETDLLLICANAMQYNGPDTVYYRQARSIQEIVKRDIANLRHEGDDGEPQPKVVRRGRPPSNKNVKKNVEIDNRLNLEHSSNANATLANEEDKTNSSYTLRKTPLYKFRSSDGFLPSNRSRNGDNNPDWSIDWNNEFPASILRADMKYGKKNFVLDEHKRETYGEYYSSGFDNEILTLTNIDGDMKRLMAVGLHFERHAYARSLATFAANLGPIAWEIASKKIQSVLPKGVKFGPGWVGENETKSELKSTILMEEKNKPSPNSPVTEEMVEAVKRLNSENESTTTTKLFPNRNGFSVSQLGIIKPEPEKVESLENQESHSGKSSYQEETLKRKLVSMSHDLNLNSPQQPDLVLQL